jgi:hypothetical protein
MSVDPIEVYHKGKFPYSPGDKVVVDVGEDGDEPCTVINDHQLNDDETPSTQLVDLSIGGSKERALLSEDGRGFIFKS